jgi:hypothetical protein
MEYINTSQAILVASLAAPAARLRWLHIVVRSQHGFYTLPIPCNNRGQQKRPQSPKGPVRPSFSSPARICEQLNAVNDISPLAQPINSASGTVTATA